MQSASKIRQAPSADLIAKNLDERCPRLLQDLRSRHPEIPPEDLLDRGIIFGADLDLAPPLALVAPTATQDEQRVLLAPSIDRGKQVQLLFDLLMRLTLRDPLTGLYNRRHFEARLDQEIRRSMRDGSACALLLLDVDDFKQINDEQGHDVGDYALQELAEVLTRALRVSDDIFRLGGDEFAVLLPAATPPMVVQRIGPRIHDALARAPLVLSVSMGVAGSVPAMPIASDELYRRADVALYAAKHAGKKGIRAFSDGTEQASGVTPEEKKALLS